MAQFSSAQWPQTSLAFKGNVPINGYPAGPKDSYNTLGGFLDPNDANNANLTFAPFGSVVSSNYQTGDQWVLGQPTGYVPRGVLMVDQGILYNEPMKNGGYALGLPATSMVRGQMRLSNWTTNASGSLVTPYLGCVPIVNLASGYIEFQPSGTVTAPSGFTILRNTDGQNIIKFEDIDPLLGSSSAGGVLIYIQVY
jgi:hypothetical protein